VRAFSHPRFVGVDLNSRFESAPGVKDIDKLKTFINGLRHSPDLRPPFRKDVAGRESKQNMNKINKLFAERGDRKLLSLYFCAGCPEADITAT
jgi:hypothetical protein